MRRPKVAQLGVAVAVAVSLLALVSVWVSNNIYQLEPALLLMTSTTDAAAAALVGDDDDDTVEETLLAEQNDPPRAESRSSSDGSPAVFYNIFLPLENYQVAEKIVKEQSLQIPNGTSVYYGTIGHKDGNLTGRMHRLICGKRLKCKHLAYAEEGFEDVTLAPLYQFCRKNPHRRVVYIHNKGSLHSWGGKNNYWRRYLTDAALDCPLTDYCNLCGLQFYPMWNPFMPGNFWQAPCDYVSRLLEPKVYEETISNLAVSNFTFHLYQNQMRRRGDNLIGRGRFAFEMWIGSHPTVVPCDQSPVLPLEPWQTADPKVAREWQLAPRFEFDNPWRFIDLKGLENILANKTLRDTEFFLLPGLIHKWKLLYGSLPDESSWIWKWYPDGLEWKTFYYKERRG